VIAFVGLGCELHLRLRVIVDGAILARCFRYDILSSDVELAQFPQIIYQQVIQSHGLLCLLKCVLVSVDLRENCTELHLEARYNIKFAHAIANRLLLKVYIVSW
jgi:hypothetical protein